MSSHVLQLLEDEDPEMLVGLLERQLSSEPPPSGDEQVRLRTQLSALYLQKLEDPLAAAVHVEELLQKESIERAVFDVATALLRCRPIAARIAEKLSTAYARLADYEQEAATLSVELSIAKPERLEGVKRRLAHLLREKLGDPAGALELLEPLVERDPGDAELLERYVDAALTAEKSDRAIGVLARVRDSTALPAVRARLGHAVGVLYLQEGELPKARAAFLAAVAEPVTDGAVLSSAHRLVALSREPEDPTVLGPALEALVALEPNADARGAAAERLLAMGAVAEDDPRAIPWWRALLGSPREGEALEHLEKLYEKTGDARGVADTLRARARATPDRKLHARLLPLLESAGRWGELCEVLEAEASLCPPEEAARHLGKLGQLRLSRLKDEHAALSAFAKSLELDPGNAVSRLWLEKLVLEGGVRLRAAELLEVASRAVASDEGILAALETRAELSASPAERLELLERAAEIAGGRADAPGRSLSLAGRGLLLAAEHRPEALPAWLERTRRFADAADERAAETEMLFEAAKAHPVDGEERCQLVCEAIDALVGAGRSGEALGLALSALEAWPGSLSLSQRIDRLTEGREPAHDRRARYERTLERLERPEDSIAMRHLLAELDRDVLSDLHSAATEWRAILALDPNDEGAKLALVEAYRRTGDDDLLPEDFGDALESLDGAVRVGFLSGKVRSLIQRGEREKALETCRALLAAPESDDAALEIVAGVAYEENDEALYREALERLAQSGEPAVQVHALERLGHFFEQAGDRRAAAESWKPAAFLSAGDPSGDERARELYERVLAAAPDDREAAEKLLELYVREGRWVNVPGIYATLLHTTSNPGVTASRLLVLEEKAMAADAIDEMVGMLDETLPYLGTTNEDARRRVMQAKARLLGSDLARRMDAARAHRALVEAFGGEDAVTEYAAFVEASLDADERQGERRWLYEWRASRSATPVNVLLEWGAAEEEYGEPLSAVRAYERAAEADPARLEPLEALARLRTAEGDLEGALSALRALRARAPSEVHADLDMRIALLLGEELNRPEEALVTVAPMLSSSPPARVVDIARRALERSEDLDRTVELVEKASLESQDPANEAANLELLIDAPLDEASLGERRESWIVRLADLRKSDPAASLEVLVRGVAHKPSSATLWSGLVALSRQLSRAGAVFDAFARASAEAGVEAATVEALGKRTLQFFDEWSSDSAEVRKTLEIVLEHAPGARWALDRLKLLLSSGGLWDDFFRAYDRAIEAARGSDDRAELFDEAALAARDLAGDPDRAIGYLEQLRALRGNEAKVLSSLERLYEKQGESAKLIALLSEREAGASGLEREELKHRIASLWLGLGDVGSAHTIVEDMLASGTGLEGVADLLEKVLEVRPAHDAVASSKSPHSRAIALLVQHYDALGRIADVIRVRELELGFARDQRRRARVVRTLVRLHLDAEGDSDEAFVRVIPKVQAFDERDPWLGSAAAAKLSALAQKAWERRGSSPESGAAQAALWAVRKLEHTALRASDPENAASVLLEGARLPFGRNEQRELVRDAAVHLDERLQAHGRAVELLRGLFLDDPTDPVVSPEVDRLARLLETVASVPERAELWESFGLRAVELGSTGHGRGYYTLAAELWEAADDRGRAIAARRLSAALGSEASLDALARLHRDRAEWRPAAEALEWAFAAADAGGKPRLGMLLADAYLALGERERAEARLEDVFAVAPGEVGVRDRLAELYREDGAWAPLATLLVAGAAATPDAERRLPLLREAAQVRFTRLRDPAGAIPLLEAATAIATTDAELALSLADALDATERYRDAARVLRQQLVLHGELRPKSRAPIHHRLAQVLVHMGGHREALSEFKAAVEIDPSNPGMLYDLARSALAENQLDLAENTYRALLLTLHRTEPGDGPSRVDVYLDLSEVAARRNDHARAADYIESSFDVSLEGLEEALRLEKALEARGRHDLVARSVERRLRAAKDPRAAAEALGQLLSLHDTHAGSAADLLGVIVRHATEIEKQVEQGATTDPEVWAILARAARVRGGEEAERATFSSHVAILEEKARAARGSEGLDLLRQAARAAERDLGDRSRAARFHESILERSPTDWDAWDAVFRLSAPIGDAGHLADLADRAVRDMSSIDDRSRLRLALARVFMAEPKLEGRATRTLKTLLDEDPACLEAAELLAEALEREGRDADLVALLTTRLEAAKSGDGRPVDSQAVSALSLRLGAALERAGQKGDAVRVYDALVDDASTDRRTLDAVRVRLEALSSPSLGDCIERILERHPGEGAAELAKRLVALRDESGDAAAALRAVAAAVELDPADATLRARLVEDYERQGRAADAREVLRRAVAVSPDDRTLFLAWVDAALRTGETRDVLEALDRGIESSPSDTDLLRERARVKQAEGRDEDALSDLERAYELDPSFAFEMRGVLERLVERDLPGSDRHTLALVDVLLEQGEDERARDVLLRFCDAHPEHVGGLERLAGLKAAEQDFAGAITAYERLLPLVGGDHEEFARLTLAFAETCDRGGGSAQARAALERAYEHAPDRNDLRERLEAIYEAEGDRERLSDLLVAGAGRATDAARRAALYFRAAELRLAEPGGAERALSAVLAGRDAEPVNVEGSLLYARALRALDRDAEALDELLALIAKNRGRPAAPMSRAQTAVARIYLESDYLHEGFDALKLAHQLDPRNVEAAYLLGLVAIDLNDEPTAARALRTVTAIRDDKMSRETRAMAFYHLGRLAQWKGDRRRAQSMAKSALNENPECDVAKDLLEALGR